MRLFIFAAVWICASAPALADLLPPQVSAARERLQANPDTYDRVDGFCKGKKRHAACVIAGTTFAGGGGGTCESNFNSQSSTIDRSCVRTDEVSIERQLPDDGFVVDSDLCQDNGKGSDRQWNCVATIPPPPDRFCKGKDVGQGCTVELNYQGKTERHAGVCKSVVETDDFYYQGHRTATREVIRCEPPSVTPHIYSKVSWRQKLLP